jgi:hypothetical protein
MPYAGKSKYPIRGSFRVKAGRMKKVDLAHYTVVGSYHSYFVDHGVVAHNTSIKRAKGQDRTVFAKKHPGYRARPFRLSSAIEALRRRPPMDQVIEAWNKAA